MAHKPALSRTRSLQSPCIAWMSFRRPWNGRWLWCFPILGGSQLPTKEGSVFGRKKTHAHIQIRDSRSIVLSRMRATGLTFFLKHLLGMASYFYPKRPNDDKKSAFDCRPDRPMEVKFSTNVLVISCDKNAETLEDFLDFRFCPCWFSIGDIPVFLVTTSGPVWTELTQCLSIGNSMGHRKPGTFSAS